MEIVTEPDVRSPAQARAYGETLRDILRYIGAIRRRHGDRLACGSRATSASGRWAPIAFGTKVEVKNLNSFRSLERAMEFEVARHAEALERGERLVQETRGWDETAGARSASARKEEANDYRYFPEPDLPPLRPSADWVARAPRRGCRSCPRRAASATSAQLGLSAYDAGVLTADVALADYFDAWSWRRASAPKAAANWVTGEFSRLLNQHAADGLRAAASRCARGTGRAHRRGRRRAGCRPRTPRRCWRPCFASGESPRAVIEREGLGQVSDAGQIERGGRGGARRVPGAGRRVSGRQAADLRLPGRPGHEAHRGPRRRALVNEELRRQLDG